MRSRLRALAMLSLADFTGKGSKVRPLLHDYAGVHGNQQPATWERLTVRRVERYSRQGWCRWTKPPLPKDWLVNPLNPRRPIVTY